jgi:death-on-curing protein
VVREEVELLHEVMIDIGGGARGLRDVHLLDSALARPQNLYAYGQEDIFQLAASYAEGIARNHPFVDGNKRSAFATADLFLASNGHHLERAVLQEHADMMVQLGQGHISREDAAAHFRMHSRVL